MRIELPFPPKELSPNARVHHMTRYRKGRFYKEQCEWITIAFPLLMAVRKRLAASNDLIPVTMTIYKPSRRGDDDNIEAAFKSGRDGVAKALKVDDSRFRVTRIVAPETKKGGLIVLEFN